MNVTELVLQEMSQDPDFEQWSQQQDPEGVSWKIGKNRRYLANIAFSKES
ncbi:MAG: hypothetical protein AB4290_28720 [Spirulina sp.]